jgi:hypothetical protein
MHDRQDPLEEQLLFALQRPCNDNQRFVSAVDMQWKESNDSQSTVAPPHVAPRVVSVFLLFYNFLQTGWTVVDRLDRFVVRLTIDKPFVPLLEVVTFRSVLFPIMLNRFLSFFL